MLLSRFVGAAKATHKQLLRKALTLLQETLQAEADLLRTVLEPTDPSEEAPITERVVRVQFEYPPKRAFDWKALTPTEMFEAIRLAPKIAGSWDPEVGASGGKAVSGDGIGLACRKAPDGTIIAYERNGKVEVFIGALGILSFSTRKEADDYLRMEGWILL